MTCSAALFEPEHSDSFAGGSTATRTAREICSFEAEILSKRTETCAAGEAVLLDHRPRTSLTEFCYQSRRHTIMLHSEGANTYAALRYDGGAEVITRSTIGQLMLIPSGHRLEGRADFPSRIRHVFLLLDPEKFCANDGESWANLDLSYNRSLADGLIAGQMRELENELDNPGPMSRLYLESVCWEIAVRVLRSCTNKTTARARGGLAPRRLRTVKAYIEANLSEKITLADLASVAGLSSTHFCRAFAASTGVRTHQYVVQRRIERAKRLLSEGKMPIAEIALAAGFADQSHFTTLFRRLVGTTPGRFRGRL